MPGQSRFEVFGLVLLAVSLVFHAWHLAPELRISQAPLNDLVFHRAAAERLARSFVDGEPLLDPWVSEWSLGYPLWRSYQPLPHLAAAGWLASTRPFLSAEASFAALHYALLVSLPASLYVGARLLGLSPLAAGLAAILVGAPGGAGELGRYGLGYGSTTWRGSGLFTQLFALHLLVWALGVVRRSLDGGTGRLVAGALLAATALSHIVFGYVAFVSAAVLAVFGPTGERARRIARLATILLPAFALLAWFVIPLLRSLAEVNHSRWEEAFKWDSFGAGHLLEELFSGRLLDSGRLPLLSGLVAVGVVGAGLRTGDPLARRLLALTTLWLALWFGRRTWGHLLWLAAVPSDLHLHRLQAAFELSAVLLASWGVDRAVRAAASVRWPLAGVAGISVLAAIGAIGVERASYLLTNARWGEESLAAVERERADVEAAVEDARRILAERPGRTVAGLAATWGRQFKVGSLPLYSFLTRAHLDQASFLYHSMSRTSDVMVLRDESDRAHDVAFAIRAVLAPIDRPVPAHFQRRAIHGRIAVYEASPEGYFGLVDVGSRYTGPADTFYEPSAAWLKSPLLRSGIVAALGGDPVTAPDFGRWQPLPSASSSMLAPRGRIVAEEKIGEVYRARVSLVRDCHALVKLTWFPDLTASIDGHPTPVRRVTPGFAAVPVPAGDHVVEVRYEPRASKPLLLGGGLLLFVGLGWLGRRASIWDDFMITRLAPVGEALATPRARAAAGVAALCLVALHPLARGQLIDGHDASEYLPRLIEFARAIGDGHVPPVWAPDLGSGHGQPLFEFAPPLVYLAAMPLHAFGLRLADSLQLGLALLVVAGAIAVYRLARRFPVSRFAAVATSGAWLFAPYLTLDLYVRATFAEASAVAVSPMALLALQRALDRPSGARVALGAIAAALVALGHNAIALLLFPALALLVIARLRERPRPTRTLAVGACVLLGGLGLAGFFWLPALLEKGFVKTDLLRQGFLHWSQHAVAPRQLLWSKWGFGLSVPGTDDGISFAIGPAHLILAIAGFWIARRRRSRAAETAGFALIAVGGALLATSWASLLWSWIEPLQYLAYPWRALFLPALFLPLLSAFAFDRLGPRLGAVAFAFLVLLNLPHTVPKGFLTFDDEYYAPRSIAARGINTTTREEYEPRWVEQRPRYSPECIVGRPEPIEVQSITLESHRQEFRVRAEKATQAEAATFYYPGWTLEIDGIDVPVTPAPVRGTISFSLPAGEHRVVLELRPTPVRRAALWVSLVTAALLLAGCFVRRHPSMNIPASTTKT